MTGQCVFISSWRFDLDLKKHLRPKKKMGDRDPGPRASSGSRTGEVSDGGERQPATFGDSVKWATKTEHEKGNKSETSYMFWIIIACILVTILVIAVIFMYMKSSSEEADVSGALEDMQDPSHSIDPEASRYYDERYGDRGRWDDFYDDDWYYPLRDESSYPSEYGRDSRSNYRDARSTQHSPQRGQRSTGLNDQDVSGGIRSDSRHDYRRSSRDYRSGDVGQRSRSSPSKSSGSRRDGRQGVEDRSRSTRSNVAGFTDTGPRESESFKRAEPRRSSGTNTQSSQRPPQTGDAGRTGRTHQSPTNQGSLDGSHVQRGSGPQGLLSNSGLKTQGTVKVPGRNAQEPSMGSGRNVGDPLSDSITRSAEDRPVRAGSGGSASHSQRNPGQRSQDVRPDRTSRNSGTSTGQPYRESSGTTHGGSRTMQ